MTELAARARATAAQMTRALLARLERRDPYWNHEIRLDHPPSARNAPRYGYGRPRHRGLEEYLARHLPTFRDELPGLLAHREDLLRIPAVASSASPVCWLNPYLPGLDTVALYSYVRNRRPRRYVEIGSGFSTAVVHRAKTDGALPTTIISVDPQPRADIDQLCDELIREPLELTDLRLFESLGPDDMLFVDASHRVFMNSDMVTFYLDVLPNLANGLLVGIHDILWPDDYLAEWADYWFSEQYLLAAFLLAGAQWIRPLFAAHYACQHPDLADSLARFWDDPHLADVDRRGFAFWFTIAHPDMP